MTKGIKIILKYRSGKFNVFVQLPNSKPKFLFTKEPEFAVRRRSKWSFVYKDQLFDFKRNTIKSWPVKKEK